MNLESKKCKNCNKYLQFFVFLDILKSGNILKGYDYGNR